ncbi:hypothetical protein F66182_1904 [Fusarium sp. NRRL 66182]|nr:hypothetical protein F66182_1904 [Fusarium sp. NRRL 66182]
MKPVEIIIALSGVLGIAQAGPCKPHATSHDIASSTASSSAYSTESAAESTSTAHTQETTVTVESSTVETTTLVATTTATTASDEPSACPIHPGCHAAGFNVDYYSNAFQSGYGNDEMSVPPSYYITEKLIPLDSSITSETYFPQDYHSDIEHFPSVFPNPNAPHVPWYVGYKRTLAGGIAVDANNYTLVYTGYYKAPETGTYELCATADNANTVYFGRGNAFDCGTGEIDPKEPALILTATGWNMNNPTQCGTVDLMQDQYYPVRNVMGNKNAVSMFEFTIKTPSGQKSHDFTGKAYPVSCGVKQA